MTIPSSLEGRPSFPDQMRDQTPFNPLDAAAVVAFGSLLGVLVVAGATAVLARAGASLLARLGDDNAPDSQS